MTTVFLGLGSNIDAERNLRLAVRELRRRFAVIKLSRVYRNEAVGFDGPDFLNLVVELQTDEAIESVIREIGEIQELAGRRKSRERYVSRRLDLDLLLFGRQCVDEGTIRVPREDVLQHSFVLKPLAEIAPDYVHPQTGRTLAEHWEEFEKGGHPLTITDVVL